MRKILLHTFALLLSTLMMVETIGIYLTKDICDPCGKSEITAQVIITDLHTDSDSHIACDKHLQEEICCSLETQCGHNELKHEHHQEHHFFKNISVFISGSSTPSFEAQSLTLIAPLVAMLLPTEIKLNPKHTEYSYKAKIPQDITLSLLCTYLI